MSLRGQGNGHDEFFSGLSALYFLNWRIKLGSSVSHNSLKTKVAFRCVFTSPASRKVLRWNETNGWDRAVISIILETDRGSFSIEKMILSLLESLSILKTRAILSISSPPLYRLIYTFYWPNNLETIHLNGNSIDTFSL